MNICFTSVSHGKRGRQLNDIYMPMNRTLGQRRADRDYGPGLEKWFLLFIMLPPDVPGHDDPERIRFEKRNKAFDLRLHLSNDAFRKAAEAGRKALVAACMMRSLDLIAARNIPDFDIQALKADVAAVAAQEGWTEAPAG